jgi:hypothetical protein
MTDEQPHHPLHETTPQRVARVAGAPLKAEPANRWLALVALTLLFVVLIVVGLGVVIGLGAKGIFSRHTDEIERIEPKGR